MAEETQKITARPVGRDVEVLTTFYPVPGLGLVPINAFLLRAAEPVLVDTGFLAGGAAYLDAIRAAIDPRDLRWIVLTHADPDHVGCLRALLDEAPRARLVTTFLGLGKLGLQAEVDPARVHLLNPGQSLDAGDRTLAALRPATFDAPETVAFFDGRTRTLFSSDSFGGVLAQPALDAGELAPEALRDAIVTWTTIDSPWLHSIVPEAHDTMLARIRDLDATLVLSSHLPPARDLTDVLLEHVRGARTATPWVGPDQHAFASMLAQAPPAPRAPAAAQPRA